MIVEFSVQNFRSIKELQTISFSATGLKSPEELNEVDNNNIAMDGGMRLLKTIGVYGANGSGKSNIIKALVFFLQAIKNEPSQESNLKPLYDPFLYQENSSETESFFQIVLILEDKKYRYGFTVKRRINEDSSKTYDEIISNEWLYGTKDKNLGEYFLRTGANVTKEKLPNGEKVPPLQYDHTLFLTHAAAFDKDGICAKFRHFLRSRTISHFNKGFEDFRWNSIQFLEKENGKDDFLSLLSTFNHKYQDIRIERDNSSDQGVVPLEKIFLIRTFKNASNQDSSISLNLSYNESAGTQKLFDMAGLLLRGFIKIGGLVIIDEVDNNFHPSLLIRLIKIFNDPTFNKSNLQLLFTSHDTNLMSPSIMRRDQFYLTEKKEDESTRLYSLADLKGIRNDADFAKQYLAGFYGALPVLDNYSNITTTSQHGGTMEY